MTTAHLSRLSGDSLGIADQLDCVDQRALSIARGLTEAQGGWRAHPSLPCVHGTLEAHCAWLRRALPLLTEGVRSVRSTWRARLGRVHSDWWWRLLPRVVELSPIAIVGGRPPGPGGAPRPVRQAMAEMLALHAELRALVREGEGRDLRTATVRIPGLGPLRCPLDVALALVPAVARRHLRHAERVRLDRGFPCE